MGMRLQYITPLLAAGVAAVAIAAAPTAFAADQQSCGSGSGTVCLSPADVPIKTYPTDVQHHRAGDMPDLTVQNLALGLGLAT
jgi:hypothetical protein